jgi:hypothetical protein
MDKTGKTSEITIEEGVPVRLLQSERTPVGTIQLKESVTLPYKRQNKVTYIL